MGNKISVTIEVHVHAKVKKVWEYWTKPEHITQWNAASDDWLCPNATNDLRVGGAFSYTMSARDASFSFDFGGIYTQVEPLEIIEYVLGDDRKVLISFVDLGDSTQVIETFEAEDENSVEMQKTGWQMILNRFKNHVELN